MTPAATKLSRPAYCPNCGYDLRGATGPVCSECGARVGKGISSQIPWMQRQWRGNLAAYLATAWLALRRPARLASETAWRLPARDARTFYRVSVILASLLLTALFGAAFAFHGREWRSCMPDVPGMDYRTMTLRDIGPWNVPAFALWDGWFILIPFGLTTLATRRLTQWLYRRVLALAAGEARMRRRLGRVGLYLSALALWGAVPMGMLMVATMIRLESPPWSARWQGALKAAQFIAGGLAAGVYLAPSLSLSVRTGGVSRAWKWWFWLLTLWAGALFKMSVALEGYWSASPLRHTDFGGIGDMVLAMLGCNLAASVLGLIASLALWKWRGRALHIVYLIVFYPLAHAMVFLGMAAGVFWMCGYAALAAGSMFRR